MIIRRFGLIIFLVLAACDDETPPLDTGGSGSSNPNATPDPSTVDCPPSVPLSGNPSYNSGTTLAKIDTDGDPSFRETDPTWQAQTNGGVNAGTDPFIVLDAQTARNDGISLGDWATISYNGRTIYARYEDVGPAGGSGEISVYAARELGIQVEPSSATVGSPQISVQAYAGTASIQATHCDSTASTQ